MEFFGGGRPGVRHPHRHGDRPVLEGSGKCQKRHHLHLQEGFAAGGGAAGLRHESLQRVTGGGDSHCPSSSPPFATSLIVAFALYKALHMDTNISTLIGVGSSICGGSAIAATAPVIGADDEEIAQAISVIFLFNVIAALIFPTLGGCWAFQRGLRPLCRHRGERHLFRHCRRPPPGMECIPAPIPWTPPPS